ncbi:hypothetical protein H0H93_005730 [Arthromyces matolae]|nr:hypothetical protein H0H93_005730 [Arthromyces matolae]
MAIALQATQLALASLITPQNFTAPGVFPTSAFSKYYNKPTATASQVQPVSYSDFDAGGYDGQAFCSNFIGGMCPAPATAPLDLSKWFAKPKPNPLPKPKTPSGKRYKGMQLAPKQIVQDLPAVERTCLIQQALTRLFPLPQGSVPTIDFASDTPLALGMAALEAIPALTGTKETGFAWSIYTGDLVSHDPDKQLSRRMLGTGPVYAALGNHDSYNQNYDHVADLWQHEQWLPEAAVNLAKSHYAAYMVKRVDGLRIISLNTDLWYRYA